MMTELLLLSLNVVLVLAFMDIMSALHDIRDRLPPREERKP